MTNTYYISESVTIRDNNKGEIIMLINRDLGYVDPRRIQEALRMTGMEILKSVGDDMYQLRRVSDV